MENSDIWSQARDDAYKNYLFIYYLPSQWIFPFGYHFLGPDDDGNVSHLFPPWLLPGILFFSALGHLANIYAIVLHICVKYFGKELPMDLEGPWWRWLDLPLTMPGVLGSGLDCLAVDYLTDDPWLAGSLAWIRAHLQGVIVACYLDDLRKAVRLKRLAESEKEEERNKAAALAAMPAPTRLDMLQAAFEAIAVYMFPITVGWSVYKQLAQLSFSKATSQDRFNELAWTFRGCHAIIASGLILHICPGFASAKLPPRIMRIAAFIAVGALLILAQHALEIAGHYTQDPLSGAAIMYAAAEVYMTILVNMRRDARQLERTEVDDLKRRLMHEADMSKAMRLGLV